MDGTGSFVCDERATKRRDVLVSEDRQYLQRAVMMFDYSHRETMPNMSTDDIAEKLADFVEAQRKAVRILSERADKEAKLEEAKALQAKLDLLKEGDE